ncbi:helix-turn-helix transcriptional regulator [Methylobacterium sp. Leaf123]|uniref:helix-turn-helix transcriptional regulator n=1 Tax=Methylobacterium sp. Leaf123 TaxID=1736264 RepID=UPI00336C0D14
MDSRLVRAGRALLGWSQQDLADRAGVKRLVIARYESGIQIPHPRNMDRVTEAFGKAGVEEIVRSDGAVGIVVRPNEGDDKADTD